MTKQETNFCELFINGSPPYVGNAPKCYQDIFKCALEDYGQLSRELLMKPEIQEYLQKLEGMALEEAKYMKRFLTENLKHIIEEASTASFTDRRGTKLSPAPLRSVAVSASKALMEMYPVKEANVSKLKIEDTEGGGITFNVIMPDQKQQENTNP